LILKSALSIKWSSLESFLGFKLTKAMAKKDGNDC
jgi:hypothetical protein